MPRETSRRTLLASLGAAALAGCVTGTETPDDGETATDTDVTAGTATDTAATAGTATDTDATAETTASAEPTPAPPASVESAWPMPAADAGRSNFAPSADGPTEAVAELWQVTATTDLSAPVVADEAVYVGGHDGRVLALDARTGAERWRQSVGPAAGTPWVVGDRLVVPTPESVVVLAADDGTESWRADTPGRERVLAASHGVYWLSAGSPAVVALTLADGTERWRTDIDDPWDPPLFASGDSVFVSSGTRDSRFWTLDAESGTVVGPEPRSGADFPAESFYLDGTVYGVEPFFGGVDARAVAEDGQGWSEHDSELVGSQYALSGGADHVYYVPNNPGQDAPGLYALSRTDGSVAWTADVDREGIGRPVVAAESVLVPTPEGLRSFDPADGTELWAREDDGIGDELVVADDIVYATDGETVRAFRSAGDG